MGVCVCSPVRAALGHDWNWNSSEWMRKRLDIDSPEIERKNSHRGWHVYGRINCPATRTKVAMIQTNWPFHWADFRSVLEPITHVKRLANNQSAADADVEQPRILMCTRRATAEPGRPATGRHLPLSEPVKRSRAKDDGRPWKSIARIGSVPILRFSTHVKFFFLLLLSFFFFPFPIVIE